MAAAKRYKRHKRPYKVTPWLSAAEKADIDEAARAKGMSVQGFCRWAIANTIEQQKAA